MIEHDMFLLGKLQLLIQNPSTVSYTRSSKATKKQRLTAAYAFDHRLVCQKAFFFLHGIGEFTLRALRKHILEVGPTPREHGSKGRKVHNAYPFETVSDAVTFIKNYASVFLVSLNPLLFMVEPNTHQLIFQPTKITKFFIKSTKKHVHRKASHLCSTEVSLTSGTSVWPISSS